MPMPDGFEAYQRSPDFTAGTIPAGLRAAHRTKPGVWAFLHVLEGRLLYRLIEAGSEVILEAGGPPGIIEADTLHDVAPLGPVRFFVEFYRPAAPAGGGALP